MGGKSRSARVPCYHMSIHYGLCHGPVDAVTAIYAGEKLAWAGRITENQTVALHNLELFGGLEREGGISGDIEFMFGDVTQQVSAEYALRLGDTPSRLPGYRGMLSVLFRGWSLFDQPGFYWASSNPYLKPTWFTVESIPRALGGIYAEIEREVERDAPPTVDPIPVTGGDAPIPWPDNDHNTITVIEKDANPAHIIYECLTNPDWGMGEDPARIDGTAFQAVSKTLYDEGLGLSLTWAQPDTIENFVNDILSHINGAIFTHPRTGLITIRLMRDDYDTGSLREVNPDNAVVTNFARKAWGETVNEMKVSWTNPETESAETVYAQNLANIAIQGAVISDSRNYHGVRSAELAQKLCDRELRAASAPVASAEIDLDRSFWDITPYEVIKLNYPEYDSRVLVMRVMEVNYGTRTDPKIRVSVVEDVFSLPSIDFVAPPRSNWVDPARWPVAVSGARLLPAPAYSLIQEQVPLDTLEYPSTYTALLVPSPYQSGSVSYDVDRPATTPSGSTTWETTLRRQQFAGKGRLDTDLAAAATSVIPALRDYTGPPTGLEYFLLIGDDDLPANQMEIALVTAVSTSTGALTIRRGVLDTAPKDWSAGTTVWSVASGLFDPLEDEQLVGQTVEARIATNTTRGRLSAGDSPVFSATAAARATKPLRPANVKLNGIGFGIQQLNTDFNLTWAHRNRFLEDIQVLSWTDASTPPEDGVEYRVEIDARDGTGQLIQANWHAEDVGTVTSHSIDLSLLSPPPAGTGRLAGRVAAIRGGERSWQEYEIAGLLPPGATPLMIGTSNYASVLSGATTTTLPGIVEDGDLLIAFVAHRSPLVIPAGWEVYDQTDIFGTNQRITMLTREAETGDAGTPVVWGQESTASPMLLMAHIMVVRASETPAILQVEKATNTNAWSATDWTQPTLTGASGQLVLAAGSSNFARSVPPDSYTMVTSNWVQTSPAINHYRESQIRLGTAYRQLQSSATISGRWEPNFNPAYCGWGAFTVLIGTVHWDRRVTTEGDYRVTTQGHRRRVATDD